MPFVEFLIGLALLAGKLRMAAVLTATGMHVFILASLGPLGHAYNSVIWPWNLAQIALVWILFVDRSAQLVNLRLLYRSPATVVLLVFATLVPGLHQFGAWDTYLSWGLYSGMGTEGVVYMDESTARRLPIEIQSHLAPAGEGELSLDLFSWSMSEFNVPDYPEPWFHRRVFTSLCKHSVSPGDMVLELWFPERSGRSHTQLFDCEEAGAELERRASYRALRPRDRLLLLRRAGRISPLLSRRA